MINYTEQEERENKKKSEGKIFGWDWSKSSAVITGIILILVGLTIVASNVGWISWEWKHFLISWQMLLIVLGVLSLSGGGKTAGWIMLLIGCFFIIPRIPGIEGIDNYARNFWPLIIVAVGLVLVFTSVKKPVAPDDDVASNRASSNDGRVFYNCTFSGDNDIFTEPVFKGGSITAVFGGVTLDLRNSSLPENGTARLTVESTFGGVTLKMPIDWNVQIVKNTAFGDFCDRRPYVPGRETQPVKLVIDARCTFGGGEINV